ncbi:MAG: DUF309 domain-containing protein [Pirellulales bacterium]
MTEHYTTTRPRLVPDQALPPYSYVPGYAPHPVSDPAGHMHGHRPTPLDPPQPDAWQACREYLWAIDLFNHGYYWEAHEAWEGLWLAAGRGGPLGDFLKGLIKLAAAAVKAREGNRRGAQRHARRAEELLRAVRDREAGPRYLGLNFEELIDACGRTAGEWTEGVTSAAPDLLLPLVLAPRDEP